MTTLLWAQLGLLQAWLLPGLAITVTRRELARADRVLLAFPVSAVTNFLIIELLTALGAYTRPAMLLIIVVEIAAIGWSIRHRQVSAGLSPVEAIRPPSASAGPLRDAIFAGAFVALAFEALAGANGQLGRIFTEWDAVMSWNPWAGEWALGAPPKHTWHYPQVLPALISIPYVMIGDPRVQQFGKMVTAAVPVLMVATGFRLSLYTGARRHLFAVAAAFAAWRIVALLGSNQPYDGLADVPAAYMVLAAAYAFVLAYHTSSRASRQGMVVLAALVLAGAILTKQAGLFALGIPFAWAMFLRERGAPVERRDLMLTFAILIVVAGHWYALTEVRIRSGADGSEIAHVTSLVQLPWTAKLIRGWLMLWRDRTAVAAAAAVLTLLAATDLVSRRILLYGLLPVFLGWALGFAYDTRNFAVGIIPLACCIVFGAAALWRVGGTAVEWLAARPRLKAAAVAAAVLVVLAGQLVVSRRVDRNRLIERAADQERKLGEAELNEFLYATLPTLPARSLVGTSYQYLGHLPGIRDRFVKIDCGSEAEMRTEATSTRPGYLLWLPDRCAESVNARLRSGVAERLVVPVGQSGTRVLYRVDSLDRLMSLFRP